MIKDNLKEHMKASGINNEMWEEAAMERYS